MERKIFNHTIGSIREIVYSRVEALLEEGNSGEKYPIIDDWFIRWNTDGTEDEFVWLVGINLFQGKHLVGKYYPFSYAEDYAAIARGEDDLIAKTTEDITQRMWQYTLFGYDD